MGAEKCAPMSLYLKRVHEAFLILAPGTVRSVHAIRSRIGRLERMTANEEHGGGAGRHSVARLPSATRTAKRGRPRGRTETVDSGRGGGSSGALRWSWITIGPHEGGGGRSPSRQTHRTGDRWVLEAQTALMIGADTMRMMESNDDDDDDDEKEFLR